MGFIDETERNQLTGAETISPRTPLPLQIVASDEFMPSPQSRKQQEVGRRLATLADELGPQAGLSRRRFFQSASGMAAAFVAMNQTYGAELFAATLDEASTPGVAD